MRAIDDVVEERAPLIEKKSKKKMGQKSTSKIIKGPKEKLLKSSQSQNVSRKVSKASIGGGLKRSPT